MTSSMLVLFQILVVNNFDVMANGFAAVSSKAVNLLLSPCSYACTLARNPVLPSS